MPCASIPLLTTDTIRINYLVLVTLTLADKLPVVVVHTSSAVAVPANLTTAALVAEIVFQKTAGVTSLESLVTSTSVTCEYSEDTSTVDGSPLMSVLKV